MTQGQYVAAAYGVVFVVVLAYVAIIAAKLARLERQMHDLVELSRRRPRVIRAETVSGEPAGETF